MKLLLTSSALAAVFAFSSVEAFAPIQSSGINGALSMSTTEAAAEAPTEEVSIYVGNLSFDLSDVQIMELFLPYGAVTQINYPRNRDTGTGRGFAFVKMQNRDEATKAIAALNESEVVGRTAYVNEVGEERSRPARERKEWTKLYVGNVGTEASEADLRAHFAQFGPVHNCFVPTEKESGKGRGFAYVTMSLGDATSVMERDHQLDGRRLRVEKSLPKGENVKGENTADVVGTKLYVGNLPFDAELSILRALFEHYGEVSECVIPKDRNTGKSRGFAFVTMPSNEDAEDAVAGMDGRDFEGRALRVNEAQPMK